MEPEIENLFQEIRLEQLTKFPFDEKLRQAAQAFQLVQSHYVALADKSDELEITGIKAITIMTFAILKKIAEGKSPSQLDKQDWREIAAAVSKIAVLADDRQYSVFIFGLYERYIRNSVQQIKGVIREETAIGINALADELHGKTEMLKAGDLSEVIYIEDCLWLALEAMIKLLACTVAVSGSQTASDLAQALATYAFAYGRLMLYSREQEIVNQFIESQHQLDAELERKYAAYLEDLQKESEKFHMLVDHAFAPDFREAFLHSAVLAKSAGVRDEEILTSTEDVDAFFLD